MLKKQNIKFIFKATKYLKFSKKFLFLTFIFFFSRFIFLNPQPVFFDAPEYLERLNSPSWFKALTAGHPPFHAGYIFLFWPLVHLGHFFSLNSILVIQIGTVALAYLTLFYFFKLLRSLFNQKLALGSTILVSLTPYFWITNISVMIETTYIFFFLISLYFFNQYLKSAKKRNLFLSAGAFGFAYFTHTLVLIWLTAFLSIFFLNKNKKKNFNISDFFVFFFIWLFFHLVNIFLFYNSQLFTFKEALIFSFLGKTNEHLSFFPLTTLIPRLLRNWLLLLSRSNSNLILLLFFLSLFWLWQKKQKQIFWPIIIWFLPSFIANQWWDSVLMGRHAILASFPICFLIVLFIFSFTYKTNKISYLENLFVITLILINLLITNLGSLRLIKQPLPYLELTKVTSSLPKNSLLLETHFARPYTTFSGQTIFINEPGWPKEKLTFLINQALEKNQPVFVSSQALADPYGLYSGPYLHPLSLNPAGKPELEPLFNQYHFEKVKTVNEQKQIFVYQIKQKLNSDYFYRDFFIPYFAKERIDFYDPLSQIWLFLKRKTII